MHLSSDYIGLIQCARRTLLDEIKDLCPRIKSIINNFEKGEERKNMVSFYSEHFLSFPLLVAFTKKTIVLCDSSHCILTPTCWLLTYVIS